MVLIGRRRTGHVVDAYIGNDGVEADKKMTRGDEFIIDGFSIHDSWKTTWPQTIARAWDIEYKLEKKNIEINLGELKECIPKAFEELIGREIKNYDTQPENKASDKPVDILKKMISKALIDFNNDNPFESNENNEKAMKTYEEKRYEFIIKILLDNSDIKTLKGYYRIMLMNLAQKYIDKLSYRFQYTNDSSYAMDPFMEVKDSSGPDSIKGEKSSSEGGKPAFETDPINEINPVDILWYLKLLCQKSEMVLEALMEEGFIIDAMENPPIDLERNLSSRLIVRKANQEYTVTKKRNSTKSDIYSYKLDRIDRIGKMPMNNRGQIRFYKFKGSRVNGWNGIGGLQHVLVLTLPERPKDENVKSLAVTDYEAAGRVFPFTDC